MRLRGPPHRLRKAKRRGELKRRAKRLRRALSSERMAKRNGHRCHMCLLLSSILPSHLPLAEAGDPLAAGGTAAVVVLTTLAPTTMEPIIRLRPDRQPKAQQTSRHLCQIEEGMSLILRGPILCLLSLEGLPVLTLVRTMISGDLRKLQTVREVILGQRQPKILMPLQMDLRPLLGTLLRSLIAKTGIRAKARNPPLPTRAEIITRNQEMRLLMVTVVLVSILITNAVLTILHALQISTAILAAGVSTEISTKTRESTNEIENTQGSVATPALREVAAVTGGEAATMVVVPRIHTSLTRSFLRTPSFRPSHLVTAVRSIKGSRTARSPITRTTDCRCGPLRYPIPLDCMVSTPCLTLTPCMPTRRCILESP